MAPIRNFALDSLLSSRVPAVSRGPRVERVEAPEADPTDFTHDFGSRPIGSSAPFAAHREIDHGATRVNIDYAVSPEQIRVRWRSAGPVSVGTHLWLMLRARGRALPLWFDLGAVSESENRWSVSAVIVGFVPTRSDFTPEFHVEAPDI